MSVWDEGARLAKQFADAVRNGRDEDARIIVTALTDLPEPAEYEDDTANCEKRQETP